MSKGNILVTGGCGYIGSHTIVDLLENGFSVVSLDNLINASEKPLAAIEKITGQRVINHRIDLSDRTATLDFFSRHQFDGLIHFAALKMVGESVEKPLEYFRNNLDGLLNVIEGQQNNGNGNFVFSSSCSVYGNAEELPVTESTPRLEAESPYALTKQMGEDILQHYCKAQPDFATVLLRYFNPAGAHPSGLMGEDPRNPAASLVPVITEVAAGKREKMTVFGNDYPTRDGSCVRDFIHIMDLAHAHTLALEYLLAGEVKENPALFNLGLGQGMTVLEAINAFEKTTGQKLNYEIGPRRSGDVVAVYSDNHKANNELNWHPQRSVEDILASAWAWEQRKAGE
ncbi:UDP-glucose 4-epimerase GalE [Lewinellaceae bacterium SD302]|nr:UDP-glucose 4-epimerase GalE [Lewinellaceae bacterium SD302]